MLNSDTGHRLCAGCVLLSLGLVFSCNQGHKLKGDQSPAVKLVVVRQAERSFHVDNEGVCTICRRRLKLSRASCRLDTLLCPEVCLRCS